MIRTVTTFALGALVAACAPASIAPRPSIVHTRVTTTGSTPNGSLLGTLFMPDGRSRPVRRTRGSIAGPQQESTNED
jgi:hypothetical protein